MKHEPYKSFLVRFWWEDTGGEPLKNWQGEIESIQTGQRWQFNKFIDMIQFLQVVMEEPPSNNTNENGG